MVSAETQAADGEQHAITILQARIGVDEPAKIENDLHYSTVVEGRLFRISVMLRDLFKNVVALFSDLEIYKMCTAIDEAIKNAVIHGNMERSSALRAESSSALTDHLRNNCNPHMHQRMVTFHVHYRYATPQNHTPQFIDYPLNIFEVVEGKVTEKVVDTFSIQKHDTLANLPQPDAVSFHIQDEGQGFVLEDISQPTYTDSPRRSGFGLALMRTFMDEVDFNPKGNAVTMHKRVTPSSLTPRTSDSSSPQGAPETPVFHE